MENIEKIRVTPLHPEQARFVRPLHITYTQDNIEKDWECVSAFDSVCIVIYNTTQNKLVFVKQFRAALYYNSLSKEDKAKIDSDPNSLPAAPSTGIALELCAGIVDKDISLAETAKHEVLEECGYDAPVESFRRVKSFNSSIGNSGDCQTLFYVEVTDDMRKNAGGGLAEEGELIEVVELSLEEAEDMLWNDKHVRSPGGFLFGLAWFFHNIANK